MILARDKRDIYLHHLTCVALMAMPKTGREMEWHFRYTTQVTLC